MLPKSTNPRHWPYLLETRLVPRLSWPLKLRKPESKTFLKYKDVILGFQKTPSNAGPCRAVTFSSSSASLWPQLQLPIKGGTTSNQHNRTKQANLYCQPDTGTLSAHNQNGGLLLAFRLATARDAGGYDTVLNQGQPLTFGYNFFLLSISLESSINMVKGEASLHFSSYNLLWSAKVWIHFCFSIIFC